MKRNLIKDPLVFKVKIRLRAIRGSERAKLRLYEHGDEFWLVEVDGDKLHVYSLDKSWFGWFQLGVAVKPATKKDAAVITMVANYGVEI